MSKLLYVETQTLRVRNQEGILKFKLRLDNKDVLILFHTDLKNRLYKTI